MVSLFQAHRRDAIDLELREAEAALARLPAVTIADPKADTAARLVTWARARWAVRITADDVAMARIAGMALLPQARNVNTPSTGQLVAQSTRTGEGSRLRLHCRSLPSLY